MKKTKKSKSNDTFPTPHAGQRKFLALPGRFRIAVCGRRFGKDVMGAIAARDEAEAGGAVLWIEPTLDQATDAAANFWEYVQPLLKKEWNYVATTKTFTHVDGGRIRFRSALVGHALRGRGWDLVIINEAANVDEKVWRTDLAPTLLTTGGKAILLGTPKGKVNWLHQVFIDASHKKHWSRMTAKTSDNPLIKLKDLNAFREELTEHEFREEFEAEFIDLATAVFPDVESHTGKKPAGIGRDGKWHASGIDLGQRDWCVCASFETETNELRGLTRWHDTPWAITESNIRKHIKRFKGPTIVDKTGVGSATAEEIADIAEAFAFTDQSRSALLKRFALDWEADRFKVCNEPQLLHELRSFVWEQAGTPPNAHLRATSHATHDDCVIAAALAWKCRCEKGDAPITKQKGFAFA